MVGTAPFVVTIDGPAGSGKSTVSARLAKRLDLVFLTTGAFYRGLAYLCSTRKVDLADRKAVSSLAGHQGFIVRADTNGTQVHVDGKDVTDELSSEVVASVASQISAYPEVRQALLSRQREFNRPPGLIAEGRDCGTVVFPHADVKIFLTASLDKRAERRSGDTKDASSQDLLKTIATRDKADTSRKVAPLAKAEDTIEIDSSCLSADQVVSKIEEIVGTRWKK